jgi:eukaryotic-like serine/threonine-protein kinase
VTHPTKIGRYEVIERVGRGGMGAVYRGRDTVLEREVAIKVMSSDFAADETARPRFYREARAAAKLQHRNIVTIFEFGEEDETPFIVMEFLRGQDLSKRMRAEPALALEEKLEIIAELCTGLHFAHEQGVIHRDVKPANIWLVPDGSVKLLDFGIAKFASSTMTRQGSVLGSISYMSPEQVNGLEVDGRADVFSAGVVLYELLTGTKPFAGDSPTAVLARIMDDQPAPVDDLPAGTPRPLVAAVMKALQKDREKRYRHAADFGADLRLVRSAIVASTASVSIDPDAAETMMTEADSSLATAPSVQQTAGSVSVLRTATLDSQPDVEAQPLGGRKVWLVPAIVGVALVAAIGGWLALRPPPTPEKVTVKILSEPAGAQVSLDGVDKGPTPADVEVDPSITPLPSVTLTSPTHKPLTIQLTSDDVTRKILQRNLEPLPPPEPKKPPQLTPAVPDNKTEVRMGGAYPFEVLDGNKVLSASETTHSFSVKGRHQLRVRNLDFFLDQVVSVDGSGRPVDWTAPGLGNLILRARERCAVVISGRSFEPPVQERMAAGTYTVEVTCDGRTRRQTFSISVGEPTSLDFTR